MLQPHWAHSVPFLVPIIPKSKPRIRNLDRGWQWGPPGSRVDTIFNPGPPFVFMLQSYCCQTTVGNFWSSPKRPNWSRGPNRPKWLGAQMDPNAPGPKWYQMAQRQTVPNGLEPKWAQMAWEQIGPYGLGSKWDRMARDPNGPKWPRANMTRIRMAPGQNGRAYLEYMAR